MSQKKNECSFNYERYILELTVFSYKVTFTEKLELHEQLKCQQAKCSNCGIICELTKKKQHT